MKTKTVETLTVAIHMAGDIEDAKRALRRAVYEEGLCVTVAPETFIYTGGEEAGFSVGLVNYPCFPTTLTRLRRRALDLARLLIRECCQRTALVVDGKQTTWLVVDPPGAPKHD